MRRASVLVPLATLVGLASLLLYSQSAPKPKTTPKPAPYAVPANIAHESNPVKPTPAGMATAKQFWGYDCAMCHGANGDGHGNMASSLKTPLQDFRNPSTLAKFTDGELFYIISKGKGEMPGETGRQSVDGIWNMVTLVRRMSHPQASSGESATSTMK